MGLFLALVRFCLCSFDVYISTYIHVTEACVWCRNIKVTYTVYPDVCSA